MYAIGPIFIINIVLINFNRYFSAISAKVPLQFLAVNFFLPLYLSFLAEFSAIWQQWPRGVEGDTSANDGNYYTTPQVFLIDFLKRYRRKKTLL